MSGKLGGRIQKEISPADISSLRAWWRADDVVLNSTGTVERLNDRSGNGNFLIQTQSINCPTWTGSFINGQPVVEFNGSSQFMITLTQARSQSGAPHIITSKLELSGGVTYGLRYTIISVFNGDFNTDGFGSDFTNKFLYSQNVNLNWGLSIASPAAGKNGIGIVDSAGVAYVAVVVRTGSWSVATHKNETIAGNQVYRGELDVDANFVFGDNTDSFGSFGFMSASLKPNRISVVQYTLNGGALNLPIHFSSGILQTKGEFQLGINNSGSFPNTYKGKLAEMMIYERKLNEDQIDYVRTYLFRRYNFPFLTASF